MNHLHTTKKVFAVLAIVGLLSLDLLPIVAFAQTATPSTQAAKLAEAPKEFSVLDAEPIDWTNIDWDSTIVLPQDIVAQREAQQSASDSGKSLPALTKGRAMTDPAVLTHFRAPAEVAAAVADYVTTKQKAKNNEEQQQARTLLQQELSLLTGTSIQKKEAIEQPVEITKDNLFHPKKLIPVPVEPVQKNLELKQTKTLYAKTPHLLQKRSVEALIEKTASSQKGETKKETTISMKLRSFLGELFSVQTVMADPEVPIISYYDGIEERAVDHALYGLSQHQNEDGSFGELHPIEETFTSILTLSNINMDDNDQFDLAVEFLRTAAPSTTRDIAFIARSTEEGAGANVLLQQLAEQQQGNGGVRLLPDYNADILTTLEALLAWYVHDYGIQEQQAAALAFILNSVDEDGAVRFSADANPSYYVTAKTAQHLSPYRQLQLSDGRVIQPVIDQLLNYLVSQIDLDTGRLAGDASATDYAYVLETLRLYNREPALQEGLVQQLLLLQNGDGMFGDSIIATSAAIRALKQPDLVVEQIVPVGNLVNGSPANFAITVRNRGYARSTNDTVLRLFTDRVDRDLQGTFGNNNIVIEPQTTAIVNFTIPGTRQFVGESSIIAYVDAPVDMHSDDNWREELMVFQSQNNVPAIQAYYIAQKHSINGRPALNVRWPVVADPNRSQYMIMFREVGQAQWQFFGRPNSSNGAFISGGFVEGRRYEVTAGVVHLDGQTVSYNPTIATVQVTANQDILLSTIPIEGRYLNQPLNDEEFVWSFSNYSGGGVDEQGNAMLVVQNGLTAARIEKSYLEPITKMIAAPADQVTQPVRLFTRLKEDAIAPAVTLFEIRNIANNRLFNQRQYQIKINGTDNISLKEADLYFYNPQSENWEFLVTMSMDGQQSMTYDWFVSEELLGDNFKVRGRLRDYRGNVSEFTETAAFSILNGTPPTLTVISPNGGEEFALGSTQQITWSSVSVNPLEDIRVEAVIGGLGDLVQGTLNENSYDWVIPNSAWYATPDAKIRVSAEDSINSMSGYDDSDDTFSIVDQSPNPLAPWARPALASSLQMNCSISQSTVIALNNTDAQIIYVCTHDQAGTPRVLTDIFYAATLSQGALVRIEPIYQRVTETDNSLQGYQTITDLKGVGTVDHRYLSWQHQVNGACEVWNQAEIYALSYQGGVWGNPVNVSNNQTYSREFDVALMPTGDAAFVWIDGQSYNAQCQLGGQRTLYHKIMNTQGQVSVLQAANPDALPVNPQIAVNDRVHVTYVNNTVRPRRIEKIERVNNQWSNPEVIYSATGNNDLYESSLLASPGRLDLAVREFDVTTSYSKIAYTKKLAAAPWQAASFLFNDAPKEARFPHLFLRNNGDIHAVFQLQESQGGTRHLAWTLSVDGINWRDAQTIDLPTHNIEEGQFIAAGFGNTLFSTWTTGFARSLRAFVNKADLTLDISPPTPVQGVNAIAYEGGVHINWDAYVGDEDVTQLTIYRRENGQGAAESIYATNNLAIHDYVDEHAVPGTYDYSVVAGDGVYESVDAWTEVVTSLPLPEQNILADGFMEMPDMNNWARYGNPLLREKTTSTIPFSGAQALHLQSIGGAGGVQQMNIPVEAGAWYHQSFWYRLDRGELQTWLGINSSNADYENSAAVLKNPDGRWRYYERMFFVPENFVGDFRMILRSKDADVLIDHAIIRPVEESTIMRDGDMEIPDLLAWRRYGNPLSWGKSNERVEAGSLSMRIDSTGGRGGFQQEFIPVEAGKWYRYSFDYYLESGDLVSLLGIASANSDFEAKMATLRTRNAWTHYERVFQVPEGENPLNFRTVNSMIGGLGYMDNITIEELDAPILVIDGSMESPDLLAWKRYGTPTSWTKSALQSFEGAQSMRIDSVGGRGGFQQVPLALVPGQWYRYEFSYFIEQGELFARIGNKNANADFENRQFRTREQNGWHQYTRTFQVPNDPTAVMGIVFTSDNFIGYIDQVRMIPVDAP